MIIQIQRDAKKLISNKKKVLKKVLIIILKVGITIHYVIKN